jgi:hypothetical protein
MVLPVVMGLPTHRRSGAFGRPFLQKAKFATNFLIDILQWL